MRSNYDTSLATFAANTSHHIALGNLDTALHMICGTVESIITEPLCAAQVFASKKLDDLCQMIGNKTFEALKFTPIALTNSESYVYIVSRLQRSGGHTRLMRNFMVSRPNAKHTVLITGYIGQSDDKWLATAFQGIECYCEIAPAGSLQSKLYWLQQKIMSYAPTHSYLFNHHQDSVAVAAIVPAMNLAASFCHHGDHHLCLGASLTHMTHYDFHPMGYNICRHSLEIENFYLPFTAIDYGRRSSESFMHDGKLVTCTAAGSNKVEIPYAIQYTDVIPQLLKKTGGSHVHIGKLSKKARAHIASKLKMEGVPSESFIYIPWVDSVWKALHKHSIDLYVGSFPYAGGLTLIESMGAGVPSISHRHLFTSLLGGADLSYEGAKSWREVDTLLEYCSNLTPEELARQSVRARNHYERYHDSKNLAFMLSNIAAPIQVPPLLEFRAEYDEWALWAVKQFTLKQLAYRFTYRAYLRLRRWITMRKQFYIVSY